MIDDNRPMHDEVFYESFLETFCQQHFNKAFKDDPAFYKKGKLKVTSVGHRSNNSDIIKGTLSFKCGLLHVPANDIWFTAYVTANGSEGEYIVVLERGGGIIRSKKLSTGEILFKY